MIKYKSTRGDNKLYTFSEVILKGIAQDGGLFVPDKIPRLSIDNLKLQVGESYQKLSLYILKRFETDFSQELLTRIISKAYSNNFDHPEITPLIHLKNNQYVLELWHGPTSAFKDIALQLTTYLFSEALKKEKYERQINGQEPLQYLVIVATSGDTGKAALEGYKNKRGVKIVVFYPVGRVSKLQELSMITQEGRNVAVFGVNGNFDDVQRIVKEIFNDEKFNKKLLKERGLILSSANSINWGRLFPQIIYHIKSYLDLVKKKVINIGEPVDIAVPTGNFGNILSAYYAKMMGIPIRKLICASNENNVYTQFLQTGVYDVRTRKLVKTHSPSMDILIGSNLERLLYELTNDSGQVIAWTKRLSKEKYFKVDDDILEKLKEHYYANWVSNSDCLSAIKKVYQQSKYLMDPHTAVAQEVTERYKREYPDDVPVVICATAHWAKFPAAIYQALIEKKIYKKIEEFGILDIIINLLPSIFIPKAISGLRSKKVRHNRKCEADFISVENLLIDFIEKREQGN